VNHHLFSVFRRYCLSCCTSPLRLQPGFSAPLKLATPFGYIGLIATVPLPISCFRLIEMSTMHKSMQLGDCRGACCQAAAAWGVRPPSCCQGQLHMHGSPEKPCGLMQQTRVLVNLRMKLIAAMQPLADAPAAGLKLSASPRIGGGACRAAGCLALPPASLPSHLRSAECFRFNWQTAAAPQEPDPHNTHTLPSSTFSPNNVGHQPPAAGAG